ncbi:MAG: 1,4-alpha-glucan branching protein domain-containing protein [Anaerolineales bacterium]
MPKIGAFTFVLHSHLPYCRMAGLWPHGEEWIHEAAAESYIPLLNALYDLRERGISAPLTISLTPVLAEQLADADIQVHFEQYLNDKIESARRDLPRFEMAGEASRRSLANFYLDWYSRVLTSFADRFHRDLVGAFRTLQEEGRIEVVTSAATHGYLPLLSRDESISLQLKTAVSSYRRQMGRNPRAVWLPECAYRPASRTASGVLRPGLEEFLQRNGLSLFFSDTQAVEGGELSGVAAGHAIGPYGQVVQRYGFPLQVSGPKQPGSSYQPYYVGQSQVAVLARNRATGLQVWSADWGYPGEAAYREFHKKDGISGMQYWRVSGARVDLGQKEVYEPEKAQQRVQEHADHFAHLVENLLADFHRESGRVGILAANYDTELFGHWWFEGMDWVREVLQRLANSSQVELTTSSEFLTRHPPQERVNLPETSWGAGGGHFTWDNADTHWMWEPIHQAEEQMARLVARYRSPAADSRAALNQTARELLLLQSSDWPFLVSTGQAKEYSIQRFRSHLDRFGQLAHALEIGQTPTLLAHEFWQLDRLFEDIDYTWFEA